MSKFDAIVIGAGAAGLAAARALSGGGQRVCLIEARGRIGGRVFSYPAPGLPSPIELGAEFIHGENASTFSIVDAATLAAVELPDDHWWSREGKWEHVRDFWTEVDRVRAKIRTPRRDVSFDEFLRSRHDLSPRLRQLARTFVEGYHASHADRISAAALRSADSEQEDGGSGGNRQFRLPNGQHDLIAWLRAGLDPDRVDVRLGTVVTLVEWSRGAVSVECRSAAASTTERFRAKAVVVTIPIGVWKAPRDQEGAIRFEPALREKDRAIEKIEAGHVVKIAFQFRERFWDDPEFLSERLPASLKKKGSAVNFLHTDDRFMPTWWTAAPLRSPILTGWAGGHAADALLAEGSQAMIDRALDSLGAAWRIPRRRLDSLLAATFTHDWQSDPFSRCAYSYAAVGGQNAHAALATPIQKTLFFAGEATSGDETGTVAGAIESGRRAARQIVGR
jgi:hypothetical protein